MKQIGFIGIGIMGMPMSRNLLTKSGVPLVVFDLNKEAVAQMTALGAASCESAADVAKECGIVFTMLPRNEHVDSVYSRLLPVAAPGQIFVDMSTISPDVSRKWAKAMEEKGALMLDAPVVKSRPAAEAGTLGIYVGGDRGAYEKILPLLSCMGSKILYLGDNGAGLVMKLCHNLLVSQIQNGVNETLTLAKKAACINPQLFREAAACGGAQNFYLDSKADALSNRDFTPAFKAAYMHKDLFLAKALWEQCGLKLEGSELAVSRYEEALAKGWGDEDFCSTYKLFCPKED